MHISKTLGILLLITNIITACEMVPTPERLDVIAPQAKNKHIPPGGNPYAVVRSSSALLKIMDSTQALRPYQAQVTASSLNSRNLPGGAIIGQFKKDQTVTVTAKNAEWYRVFDGRAESWVNGRYLQKQSSDVELSKTLRVPELNEADVLAAQKEMALLERRSSLLRSEAKSPIEALPASNTQKPYYDECSTFAGPRKQAAWMETGTKKLLTKYGGPQRLAIKKVFFSCGVKPLPATCGIVSKDRVSIQRFISLGTSQTTYLEKSSTGFETLWSRLCRNPQ